MKKVTFKSNESSFHIVKNVGSFILIVSIIGALFLGLTGLQYFLEFSESGIRLMTSALSLFLVSYFAFGICKGLSELVKNSYFQRKLSETKAIEEGYEFEEI